MTAKSIGNGGRIRVVFHLISNVPEEKTGAAHAGTGGRNDADDLGVPVEVDLGTTVYDAAVSAGVFLNAPCGGGGSCGKCRVFTAAGLSEPTVAERKRLSENELAQGLRLACQACILGNVEIAVPRSSLSDFGHRIVTHSAVARQVLPEPDVAKRFLEIPPPDRGDDISDVCRLRRTLGRPVSVDLDVMRLLPSRLRESAFRGTAVTVGEELLDFEPGDTTQTCFAVALDVGTTTMAAELVDLRTGKVAAVCSRLNPQTAFGDDVLSRIVHVQNHESGLAELHGCVIAAVNGLIRELLEEAHVAETTVYQVVVSGNTPMQQLFLALDPKPLGVVPFVPAAAQGIRARASQLGLGVHPRAEVRTLPIIGGFVGGDISAGILATELTSVQGPALFVDIGTNGEIVLWDGTTLIAASTAAGPAFEGARISQGMRACRGAIDRVSFEDRLSIHVIGGVPPVGLCGSALIDAAAELLRLGGLTSDGRLLEGSGLGPQVPEDLRARLVEGTFVLANGEESGAHGPIRVTQRDLRELQLAAGAIRAGMFLLLRRCGLKPEDVTRIFLAGGFGNFIRRDNAQRIGLLPGGIPLKRISYQGNTSLAGARLVAVSRECARAAERMAASCTHIDLSAEPGFAAAFAEAMLFPEE